MSFNTNTLMYPFFTPIYIDTLFRVPAVSIVGPSAIATMLVCGAIPGNWALRFRYQLTSTQVVVAPVSRTKVALLPPTFAFTSNAFALPFASPVWRFVMV